MILDDLVRRARPELLSVILEGNAGDREPALALVRRMLSVDRDVTPFNRAAARIPWLAPLANRMLGVKPPRYSTLWEACVNAIVFQQVSLFAASVIMRRLLLALAPPFEREAFRWAGGRDGRVGQLRNRRRRRMGADVDAGDHLTRRTRGGATARAVPPRAGSGTRRWRGSRLAAAGEAARRGSTREAASTGNARVR